MVVFHTVLPRPDEALQQNVKEIAKVADGIIVMTKSSSTILENDYQINKNKITVIKNFRIIAFTEGVSYLVLLFVAMPLKYMLHIPEPVKYCGWLHGVLFVFLISLQTQIYSIFYLYFIHIPFSDKKHCLQF